MKPRRYSRLRAAIYGTPWAILPSKLEEIAALVEDRALSLSRRSVEAYRAADPLPDLCEYLAIASPSGGSSTQRIAVLNLFGTVAQRMNMMMEFSGGTSTELFGKAFDEAISDPSVSAVVINIDSPGGAVPGVMELSDRIFSARGAKPIVSVVNPMMASAALWIGTAASEVVAVPSALQIGSIGVLNIQMESSRRHEMEGDTFTILRSTPLKAEGLSCEPLTEAAAAHIQGRIDAIHRQFVAAVARNRGVTSEKVEGDFGRGRTLMAAEALAAGLVDRIATFEEVVAGLAARAASAQSPAPTRARISEGKFAMNPKVRLALVQAGLIRATASAEEATAALNLFFEARGEAVPTDPEKIVQAICPAAATPLAATPATTPTASAPAGLSVDEITALVQTAGASLPPTDRLECLTGMLKERSTLTLPQVLDRINQRATAANPPAGPTDVRVTAESREKFCAAARDAIVLASLKGQQPEKIFDVGSGDYVSWKPNTRNYGLSSPLAIASQCLVQAGIPYQHVMSLAPMHIAQLVLGASARSLGLGFLASSDGPAYNVTGMFSNIFLDAANVTLRKSFDDARTTYQQWMGRGEDIRDFKPVNRVISGEIGDPKAIPEDGTFDETTFSDGKESYKLTVWGEIFSHSWQTIVNDSLSAFAQVEMKMGNAMKRKMNRLAYQVLKDNAALSDGGALFNSTAVTSAGGHANLSTGAISDYGSAFSTLTRAMRVQRGLDPTVSAVLNLAPKYCIFPTAIRDPILQRLVSLADPSADHSGVTNIYRAAFEPIEEAELDAAAGGSDTAFYLAANPVEVDTVEYATLLGLPAPIVEQEVAFDRLAMRRRIYFAFGVKALDFRGLQKHNGA